MNPLYVFVLALALDIILGEPPARIHPVVLMGRAISYLKRHSKRSRLYGTAIAIAMVSSSAITGHALIVIGYEIYPILGLIIAAFLLKSTFAIRCLLSTSSGIACAIQSDISKAREMLPALVSRDPNKLTPQLASSAVIESLSENYVDSILSPIFYYVIFSPFGFGVEAALAFKAISTMDSMLGYKTDELLKIGFVPAKLDDLANYVPARLSLPLMVLGWPTRAFSTARAAFRYHASTPSPNSGWPMAATAGALGIRMEKPGVYVILDDKRMPSPNDVKPAVVFMSVVTMVTVVVAALAIWGLWRYGYYSNLGIMNIWEFF